MSVATRVIPDTINIGYDRCRLEQLLFGYQTRLNKANESMTVSLSQKIDRVAPLSVLQFLLDGKSSYLSKNEVYFYWEDQKNNQAILGYGITQSFEINTADRFIKSQQFVKECFDNIIQVGNSHLEEVSPHIFCGFTFFPETNYNNFPFPSALCFLPKIQLVNRNKDCYLTFNILITRKTNVYQVSENIIAKIQSISSLKHEENITIEETKVNRININQQTKDKFKASVTSVLKSIQSNRFQKLVLANAFDLSNSRSFSVIKCLKNLRIYHPDCYLFAMNNGKNNCFIGASPERLISINNNQLITDALAGSSRRGKTASEDHYFAQKLLKSSKERREHQVVIEYIIEGLINLGLTPYISPLKILKLSNIQHLWTPIYTEINADINPLEVVARLHPTPAVSGFPKGITCQEIKRYETFERGFYAAPLGWINYDGNSEFIVGIRSALISGNYARLYAGAGIVEGSEPEKELAEIELKFQGLLKALSS
ncbi:MAG: isochorismate synthase [Crocosphaera sp.]|nr:isochorismate synthase [Crocosphaera sp.]